MQPALLPCAAFALAIVSLPAQSTTLTSDEVLRIHFVVPAPPSPPPDVLQFGLGLVTVNAPYSTRTARLWDGDVLLGTAVSSSFGSHTGALSLGVCNSFCANTSLWNFDSPGIVSTVAPLQNGTIQGIVDLELGSGSITLDLANVTMMMVRATSAGGGSVASPSPVLLETVVVPKLTGPVPGLAGAVNTWTTTGSAPGALMVHVLGFAAAPALFPSAPPVFFDLAPPVAIFAGLADGSGVSSLAVPVPATASGITLLAQSAELPWPALRVSNFVSVTFP